MWEEDGKYPHFIVEILSDITANVDRTTKKQLYQDTFRTPEYFWFEPNSLEFAGFVLVGGEYEPIPTNDAGHMWSKQLGLFIGIHNHQLRYFTADGSLVPSPEEAATAAKEEAIATKEEATAATQKAAKLAARLKELGVDPKSV